MSKSFNPLAAARFGTWLLEQQTLIPTNSNQCDFHKTLRYICAGGIVAVHIVYLNNGKVALFTSGVKHNGLTFFGIDHVLFTDGTSWNVKKNPLAKGVRSKGVDDIFREIMTLCTLGGEWKLHLLTTAVQVDNIKWDGIWEFGNTFNEKVCECLYLTPPRQLSALTLSSPFASPFNTTTDSCFAFESFSNVPTAQSLFSFDDILSI